MIVIMKETNSPIAMSYIRPHCVFEGNMREAKEICKELNNKSRRNFYEPVKVPLLAALTVR